MLVGVALLTLVQAAPYLVAVTVYGGVKVAAGNRQDVPELPEWANRAARAHRNMLENAIPFAALVLVADAAGVRNEETAAGATQFFWARVAYAAIYVAGIPYLRTVAFLVALFGMLDIAAELFRSWSPA